MLTMAAVALSLLASLCSAIKTELSKGTANVDTLAAASHNAGLLLESVGKYEVSAAFASAAGGRRGAARATGGAARSSIKTAAENAKDDDEDGLHEDGLHFCDPLPPLPRGLRGQLNNRNDCVRRLREPPAPCPLLRAPRAPPCLPAPSLTNFPTTPFPRPAPHAVLFHRGWPGAPERRVPGGKPAAAAAAPRWRHRPRAHPTVLPSWQLHYRVSVPLLPPC